MPNFLFKATAMLFRFHCPILAFMSETERISLSEKTQFNQVKQGHTKAGELSKPTKITTIPSFKQDRATNGAVFTLVTDKSLISYT